MSKSPTKVKSTTKPQKVIRLTIDDRLQTALDSYQIQYPLLSSVELIKVILSEGLKKQNSGFIKAASIAKSVQVPKEYQNLSEDQQFEVLSKFGLM